MHARKVPVDVKAHFKAYCARRGYTLDAAVRELMIKAAT
jgi:putative hemolysin